MSRIAERAVVDEGLPKACSVRTWRTATLLGSDGWS